MFSKEESKKIRQEFWTWFGQSYPRKWLLYNTKIKDVTLKFTFTNKCAQVSIDIEPTDELIREYYYDKILSLKGILTDNYLPDAIFNAHYTLDNGKVIPRVLISHDNVGIYNRNSWKSAAEFLNKNMLLLEDFFLEYKDVIDS